MKVYIYSRFSTDRQDARSIDDQVRRCREFALARGFEVVAEFSDAATSGAHTARAGLQRMLSAATARRSGIHAVLVDDLSRLSRDLGNTWRIIFEDLAAAQVRVFDVHTGMSSDAAGARLTFGALALVNDTFLQLVKTETHRGLEGRAIAGFWTGGRCYGYRTRPEDNPPDPEHPRAVVEIDPDEAAIVRRVFGEFLAPTGLAGIARGLNRDRIPAPYDDAYGKRAGRGWQASTVRAMLQNPRYSGQFTWNKRRYVRVPGSPNRRAVERPRAEWRTTNRPELAIVDARTWAEAVARFKERGRRACRKPGTQEHRSIVSGLLRCGVCGASMVVCSAKFKNGIRYANYRCAANRTKGDTVCANRAQVSEKRVREALVGALRDALRDGPTLARMTAKFNERMAQGRKRQPPNETRAQVAESEKVVANLADTLGRVGYSEAVAARLQAEEQRLRDLREALAAETAAAPTVTALPGLVARYVRGLRENLEADAGPVVRRLVGHLRIVPKSEGPDRYFEATGPLRLSVSDNNDCGGATPTISLPEFTLRFRIPSGRRLA